MKTTERRAGNSEFDLYDVVPQLTPVSRFPETYAHKYRILSWDHIIEFYLLVLFTHCGFFDALGMARHAFEPERRSVALVKLLLFKSLSRNTTFLRVITNALEYAYRHAAVPDDWVQGLLTPVPKKGKPIAAENCRPVVVLPLPMRLLSTVLAQRLAECLSLEDDQGAYRKHRSIHDHIFTLLTACEASIAKGNFCYLAFIDFSTAFDTVNQDKLLDKMISKNVSRQFLRFFVNVYSRSQNRVKWDGKLSDPYDLQRGVRQGDPLSGLFFNLYLDGATETVTKNRTTTIKIGDLPLFLLKYADDIVLLSPSAEHLQESVDRLVDYSVQNDLIINVEKSVCMVIKGGSKKSEVLKVSVNGVELEQVVEFKYLGFVLGEKLALARSEEYRFTQCQKSFYVCKRQIANMPPNAPFSIAEKVFESVVVSTGNFCSEILGGSGKLEQFQLKFFNEMFGLRSSTPKDAFYHLTVRYPLHIQQTELQLNFLKKVSQQPRDSILYNSLVQSAQNSQKRHRAWLRTALKPVQELAGFAWSDDLPLSSILEAVRNLSPALLTDQLKQKFETELKVRLASGASRRGKLFFLLQMCPEPNRAPYLDYMPLHLITAILRLLTSGHHFLIETGRWRSIPQENRLCTDCGILDSEEHALFLCPRYEALRRELQEKLAAHGSPPVTDCAKLFLNYSVRGTLDDTTVFLFG